MKNSRLITTVFVLIFSFLSLYITAQVGIGTTTPNSSSLLDIQSTSKGFLAPRMTTAQKIAISAPEVGLMVFDTDINKFYFWAGSSWIANLTNQYTRDNYVLVKTTADLPTPVSGVITLASGTLYEVNGTIYLSNKIDLNGSAIKGEDVNNDKLIFLGTGALFTGTKGGLVKTLTIAGNGTNNCFSLNDATKTLNFIFRDSFVANFSSIGGITGFNMILFTTIGCLSNTDGITFTSNDYIFLNDLAWFDSSAGTFIKYAGSIKLISMIGGMFNVSSGATGIDVTGLTSVSNDAILKSISFSGVGTRITGTYSKEWEIEASGLITQTDDVATGSIYINTAVVTTISTINTPVKVSGTTSSTNLFRSDTGSQNNRLRYTGTKTRKFTLIATFSMLGGNNKVYAFHIYKNGSNIPSIYVENNIQNAGDIGAATIMGTVELATNDYVELWVENLSGTQNCTINAMNFIIY